MFLSLKQQVSNTNNDVSTFESKLNELKEQTDLGRPCCFKKCTK